MTKLLQKALAELAKLPDAEQDEIAEDILAKLEPKVVPTENLQTEPFFGIWRERDDVQDSSAWVKRVREREWSRS